ncbi:hypothetical protein OSK38_29340, partial [Escherichia coli]|nr:hypothetical protein [Escherichia coli]
MKALYADKLLNEKIISKEEAEGIHHEVLEKMKAAYEKVPKEKKEAELTNPPETVEKGLPKIKT